MFKPIRSYCDSLIREFASIPEQRKQVLNGISKYIAENCKRDAPVNLVYICTHNSRRSHFGQVWAKIASLYFAVPGVNTYSGGTEATAFNNNAIDSLTRAGFKIRAVNSQTNSVYHVYFDDNLSPIECFSKIYDHPQNPQKEFAAIMTCGEAEENCPFTPGASLRIATTYEDPKIFDGTREQDLKYDERCREIARETMYVFSEASNALLQKSLINH